MLRTANGASSGACRAEVSSTSGFLGENQMRRPSEAFTSGTAVPGFTALVAIGPLDHHGVFAGRDDLVERFVELGLVRIADFAMVGNFDNCLARPLRELWLVEVRKQKLHCLDRVCLA